MDSHSQETLRRIEDNDATLTGLVLFPVAGDGRFNSKNGSDYSKLGTSIGKNSHITKLDVELRADAVARCFQQRIL